MLVDKAPQTAGWLGFIVRGRVNNIINGIWTGYAIVVQHIFLDVRVDNVRSIAKYMPLTITPGKWYWLSTEVKKSNYSIFFRRWQKLG